MTTTINDEAENATQMSSTLWIITFADVSGHVCKYFFAPFWNKIEKGKKREQFDGVFTRRMFFAAVGATG